MCIRPPPMQPASRIRLSFQLERQKYLINMHFLLHSLLHLLSRLLGESVGNAVLKPFFGFIDGSDEAAVAQPLYSAAEAKRKRGHFLQAREDVRAQLRRFPSDFQGQMLLAEIEAQDLKDLAAAQLAVQRILQQPEHPPAKKAYALTTLADWQLKYARDREAARACF